MSGKNKKVLAIFMATVMVLLPVVTGFSVAAEATWLDGVKGQYQAVSAMPANSILVGKTPTKDNTTTAWAASEEGGTGAVSVMNDGALAADAAGTAAFSSLWGPKHYGFTYDMGEKYVFDSFLIGSGTGGGQRLAWVKIYVGNSLDTLYADANLVAEVKGLTRSEMNVVVKPAAAVTGRYVGFGCYSSVDGTLDGTSESYSYYGWLNIGELGAYGKAKGPWDDAVKGEYQAVTAMPANSLLIGKTPTKDNTTTAWAASEEGGTGAVSVMNDGALAADAAGTAAFNNLWGPKHYGFTYDMGEKYVFDSFLIGSGTGGGQRLGWVKIYVGNALDTLYADANLVAEVKGLTRSEMNVVVRLGENKTATGRYVGFGCYSSLDGTLEGTSESYSYYGWLNIGELGAYGKAKGPWDDAVKGEYQAVSAMPANSLLIGKTPTKDNTTTAWAASEQGGTGALSVMNDGALAADAAGTAAFNNLWGPKHYGFTYDMGEKYVFDSFLIGSGTGGGQRLGWVKIYVGNDLDTLYSDANLAAVVKGLTRSEMNVVVRLGENKTAAGRYVGFGCYSSLDGTLEGTSESYSYYGWLNIGELGAYGKAAPAVASLGAQIRGSGITAASEKTDLRFGFQLDVTGVTQTDVDAGNISPKVKVGGVTYDVTGMGILTAQADKLTEAETELVTGSANNRVVEIPAKKVYEVADDHIVITGVVTDIANSYFGTELSMRTYLTYFDGETTQYIYSDVCTRCVSDLLA